VVLEPPPRNKLLRKLEEVRLTSGSRRRCAGGMDLRSRPSREIFARYGQASSYLGNAVRLRRRVRVLLRQDVVELYA